MQLPDDMNGLISDRNSTLRLEVDYTWISSPRKLCAELVSLSFLHEI